MNNISLPLWETVSHSFVYVIKNIEAFFKICSIFLILWILEIPADFPSLCLIDTSYCKITDIDFFFSIILFIASTIIAANFIRYIILRQESKWFQLSVGTYNLRYIGYTLLISSMIVIPSALMFMIKENALISGVSEWTIMLFNGIGLATFIGLSIFCFRLYLVYGASAIDDREMTLAKSYTLTSGNMLKICIGQILLMIPSGLIFLILCR